MRIRPSSRRPCGQLNSQKDRVSNAETGLPSTAMVSAKTLLMAAMISIAGMALIGCAKLPPSQSSGTALSGKRLVITLRFRQAVNPNFHYFFLINYDTSMGMAGNQNAPGPIPVIGPANANQGYGNGFATGSGTSANGFTDFVRFEGNSYRLFHVVGNPTLSNFVDEGMPVNFTLPNSNNPTVLQFEIDLAQLVLQPTGAALPDQMQTISQAKTIRWLQMNIVATDVIPRDQTQLVAKQVESLGDTRSLTGASSFLTLDMTQLRTYDNQSFIGQTVFEPADNDVFGSANPDPSLDLVDYSIIVRQQ